MLKYHDEKGDLNIFKVNSGEDNIYKTKTFGSWKFVNIRTSPVRGILMLIKHRF